METKITTFKIRVDSIKEHAIGFELLAGEAVDDTYVNVIDKGGYGHQSRLILTPNQFQAFGNRLIAYIYTDKKRLTDNELLTLWDLRLTIYDDAHQTLGSSIFAKNADRLTELSEKRKRELKKIKERRI